VGGVARAPGRGLIRRRSVRWQEGTETTRALPERGSALVCCDIRDHRGPSPPGTPPHAEAPGGVEPPMEVLQTSALPLGYGARGTGENPPDIRRSLPGSKSGKPDSNRRPPPWQGGALPTELFPRAGADSPSKSCLCPVLRIGRLSSPLPGVNPGAAAGSGGSPSSPPGVFRGAGSPYLPDSRSLSAGPPPHAKACFAERPHRRHPGALPAHPRPGSPPGPAPFSSYSRGRSRHSGWTIRWRPASESGWGRSRRLPHGDRPSVQTGDPFPWGPN
jgi:hypothetical protein